MYDFLAVIGGFSLVLCVVIVLLFPALLAVVIGAQWLWLYAFYIVVLLAYAGIVRGAIQDKEDGDK